jgi:hypothetical protein
MRVTGDEAVGVYTAGWYAGLETPDNKKFVGCKLARRASAAHTALENVADPFYQHLICGVRDS